MEAVALKTVTEPSPDNIFRMIPQPGLARLLARAFADTAREFGGGPASYLRVALFPERVEDWFPVKLGAIVAGSLAHPLETLRGAFVGDEIDIKRRGRWRRVLLASATIHGVLVIYFAYLAFLSPYARLRVVNRAYRKFDVNAILAPLHYPSNFLRPTPTGPAMDLDEIRKRAKEHREELARARERAEIERKEKEEAEKKAAAEAAKLAAEKKPSPTTIGEINEAPIKDIISKLYDLYQAGGLDIPDMKFSVMAGFKVEPDGSLSNIRIITPSKSKIIDTKALEILWNIGESHALGAVSELTSNTISLDVTEDLARLRVTAFAPTPEIAKNKATLLSVLFWGLSLKEKATSPETAQLLSMIKVKPDGKRIDTDLIVTREKAAAMLRARFAHPDTPPQ